MNMFPNLQYDMCTHEDFQVTSLKILNYFENKLLLNKLTNNNTLSIHSRSYNSCTLYDITASCKNGRILFSNYKDHNDSVYLHFSGVVFINMKNDIDCEDIVTQLSLILNVIHVEQHEQVFSGSIELRVTYDLLNNNLITLEQVLLVLDILGDDINE